MKREMDNIVYSFSAKHLPVAELSPGGFGGRNCRLLQRQAHQSGQDLASINLAEVFPATGPFFIVGAEPGDALEIEIVEIKTAQQGIGIVPETGVLPAVSSPEVKIFGLAGNSLVIAEGLSVPVQPMVGVIGVAPPEGEIGNSSGRVHGGRLLREKSGRVQRSVCPSFMPVPCLLSAMFSSFSGDGAVQQRHRDQCRSRSGGGNKGPGFAGPTSSD